jgi:hypothetical protein
MQFFIQVILDGKRSEARLIDETKRFMYRKYLAQLNTWDYIEFGADSNRPAGYYRPGAKHGVKPLGFVFLAPEPKEGETGDDYLNRVMGEWNARVKAEVPS